MGRTDNVATFYLAHGYTKFGLFCTKAEMDYEESLETPICIEASQIDSDDEDGIIPPVLKRKGYRSVIDDLSLMPSKHGMLRRKQVSSLLDQPETANQSPRRKNVYRRRRNKNFYDTTTALDTYPSPNFKTWQSKILTSCRFCKQTCPTCWDLALCQVKNWTSQREAYQPGKIVSVDQLVSPTPGLVPQMTGRLTTKRYRFATVSVDQFSGFSYLYLQKSADADETILAKRAFEETAR
jgi:hypothetical protein